MIVGLHRRAYLDVEMHQICCDVSHNNPQYHPEFVVIMVGKRGPLVPLEMVYLTNHVQVEVRGVSVQD